jgi:uncharacterized protein DUF6941
MVPRPVAVGLWLCERVLIEQGTTNPSLIAAFTGMGVEQVPARPLPFSVLSTLTDAEGRGTISLRFSSLESGEVIYRSNRTFLVADRLTHVNVHFRVERIVVPEAGFYEASMYVDDDLMAGRRLRVHLLGE